MASSQYVLLIFIAVLVIAAGVYLAIFISRRKYRLAVEELQPKLETATRVYLDIFQPVRLVDREDFLSYSLAHTSLLQDIERLKKHRWYRIDIFEDNGICKFEELLSSFDKLMAESNEAYYAIQELMSISYSISKQYSQVMDANHYFAHSEMVDFLKTADRYNELINIILPKYEAYVTDEEARQLISKIRDIDRERDVHNKLFVELELEKNASYFDTVLGQHPLDPQQRESIVKLEDNCLVIASAGSGKTSTIVGKVKYLVERRGVDPSKILILTYTKKAAVELSERIKVEGITSGTFHGLAYKIISEVTGLAPSICKTDVALNVFRTLLAENADFLRAINTYIIDMQSMMKLEHEYTDAFSYFEDRKKYGIQALFPDADGKLIFTNSEEEKRICSILTKLGVIFRYEYNYEIDTRTPEYRQYKPDFSIYFKDADNNWRRIYLEHFAINASGQVPLWFGDGTKGGWSAANKKYLDGIAWKRETHKKHKTILIETTSANFMDGTIESVLKSQLIQCGVPINEKTDQELYDMLVSRNKQLEKTIFTLISSFTTLLKANEKSLAGLIDGLNANDGKAESAIDIRNRYIMTHVMKPFVELYEKTLQSTLEIDFTDAIIKATNICREGMWKHYDYILVDEFQDISIDRYKFIQSLRSESPKTKLFCVGDDWQSIFRFAGSDMALFYDFEKVFGATEVCRIETTYRFHQPIIDKSSEFIMRNPEQQTKKVRPPKDDIHKTYLTFRKYDSKIDNSVLAEVETIVRSIPSSQTILIIGRYNYDAVSLGYKGKIDASDFRIRVNIAGRDIFFLSVHSAKGLEADNVILVNCNQGAYGFPSLIEDDPILDFVLSKSESYPYAEERRLFYVAMTRAKKHMYVLYDSLRPSPFISEFLLKLEIGSYLCPKCLEGMVVAVKSGEMKNGNKYQTFACSNRSAHCDFFEVRYVDLTPPGIRITEDMTAQDLEKMRENRRASRKLVQEL